MLFSFTLTVYFKFQHLLNFITVLQIPIFIHQKSMNFAEHLIKLDYYWISKRPLYYYHISKESQKWIIYDSRTMSLISTMVNQWK